MLIKRNRIPYFQIILVGLLPSFIKILLYRIRGYKIGKSVKIGPGSVIIGDNVTVLDNTKLGLLTVIRGRNIKIERYVQIGSFDFIDCDNIRIGEDSRINEQVIIGGLKTPSSSIDIGARTIIMEYSFINPTMPIKIGDNTGIGGHCLIFTHGTWLNALDGFPYKYAPVTIGKNVWLAWRVFILPGVEIGDNVVIGANSLVNKSIPSNSLAAGEKTEVLKNNYPSKLSETERAGLIQNILQEFLEYLEYHEFNFTNVNNDTGSVYKITNETDSSFLYQFNDKILTEDNGTDNVLLNDSISENYIKSEFKMVVNLADNTRKGSSKIGEELAKYFSRYGIRFKRLD